MSQDQGTAGSAALGRYQDLGLIGQGSMAEVRRVWDPALDRAVAMKILRINLIRNPLATSRFKKEARAIARLQHPGVIPIHDLGVLPDGRPYYTMKEIEGRTLAALIREVHGGSAPEGWSVRRLIETLHRVSEAVAFAHARGILHRDIKPDNVLLGRFGEVLVVDWGLAKSFGDERPLSTTGALNTADISAAGSVAGTPAYMAPEQAVAGPVSPATDVYALGATLYEILAGKAPYSGPNAWLVLLQLKTGPPPALSELPGVNVPEPLARIVSTAMHREPARRFADAGALAAELGAWLDGARKADQSAARLAEADALIAEARDHRDQAATLGSEAREALASLPPHAPVALKRHAWQRQSEATEASRRARHAELQAIEVLRETLAEAPDLGDAHERLADLYQARHAEAERDGDLAAAAEAEQALRTHDRGRHRAWLDGRGTLTLLTDPPGATALLFRYTLQDRQLVPVFERSLGATPIVDLPLGRGSWRVDLRLPGRATVIYPVRLDRLEVWTGAPPGASESRPVPLPVERALRPTEVFVPGGWSWSGAREARIWTEDWVVSRLPVTCGEYLAFLNALAAQGRLDDALRHAAGRYRHQDGLFAPRPTADPRSSALDLPATEVDWADADAYAAWLAETDGRPWQLLPERVWEKAARGVDGRLYPWGDELDPTFCNMGQSAEPPTLAPVGAFPADQSPYGVCDMAGNCSEWCADAAPAPEGQPRRVIRGGCWLDSAEATRLTRRDLAPPHHHSDRLGFRVGWPWRA